MRRLALALALVPTIFGSAPGAAQAPDAAAAAGWAETFLGTVTSLEARFQQDAWVPVHARTRTSYGRIRVARPGHVRMDYDAPANVGVANGSDFLWYEPGDGTWPGQYTRGTNDAVSAAFELLVGGSLARDFASSACASTSATAPAGTVCVELRPRGAASAFERVRLYVLSAEGVRGQPARLAIEQHDGTWNTFTFRELRVNGTIDESVFAFEPPAGTRATPASR